jgi:hypothetical protein
MRYHVIYLAAGQREALRLEAPNAAAAVSAVTALRGHAPPAFELLSVVPTPAPSAKSEPEASSDD